MHRLGLSRALASRSSSTSSSMTGISVVTPLPFTELPYRGASVDIQSLPNSPDDERFLDLLSRSLPILADNDYNSCWLRVPTARSAVVASASSQHGFELHHIDTKSGGTIVMKKWLREGAQDKVPPYPNTQVGCAGLVLNDKNEMLLVKEWTGPLRNRTKSAMWKLPGGLLDVGESFAEASTREVWEETGVACHYEGVLTLWHRHGLALHGISDIYVVCLLRPKVSDPSNSSAGAGNSNHKTDRSIISVDPAEISDCCWMPVAEFLETQKHPLITRILGTSFGLQKKTTSQSDDNNDDIGRYYEDKVLKASRGDRLKPHVMMKEHDVQFGTRPPISTYIGVSGDVKV